MVGALPSPVAEVSDMYGQSEPQLPILWRCMFSSQMGGSEVARVLLDAKGFQGIGAHIAKVFRAALFANVTSVNAMVGSHGGKERKSS